MQKPDMNKNRWLSIFILLIILVLGVILVKNLTGGKNTIKQTPTRIYTEVTPTQVPTVSKGLTPTRAVSSNNQNAPATPAPTGVSGGSRGQVTCTLTIPPDNQNYGQANFGYNWNNLVAGANGTAKVELCADSGGKSSLMSENFGANGSSATSANWIILNGYYTFTLYDEKGGDLPQCGGASLSSCVIDTLVKQKSH